MPCSRSTHSYPAPAPPQALMKLPAVSKTMTGGAAILAYSGLRSVRGRCNTHTLSCASMAKLDGSPSFHLGGTFGHVRSTSNVGRLRAAGACAATVRYESELESTAATTTPTARARKRFAHVTASS